MKRYTHKAFLVAVVAAIGVAAYFYVSSRWSRSTNANEPVRYRSYAATSEPSPDPTAPEPGHDSKLVASIELQANETLLDLYSFNLDFDDEEEQLLIVRQSSDAAGRMRIILADYSPYSKRWTRAWEGDTLVTKVKTFQVGVSDLIGDHNLNIVCTGMNDENLQATTVFWKDREQRDGAGLSFVKIFEQAADAVFIEEAERPESYKLGQTNAESWPISVYRADTSSGNFLDQTREAWVWSFSERSYIKASSERIAGASIAQKMAASILDGNAETFKAFLEGTWYKESSDPLAPGALFITFQNRDDSIMFSGDGVIEIYQWESSNPTRYGLYIASRNQSVRDLRRLMDIELSSAESINVRVFQDYRIKADIAGTWDGRYRKLSPEISKSFAREPAMAASPVAALSGTYASADGSALTFAGSEYRLISGATEETGSFAVFTLDSQTVLDMKAVRSGSTPVATRRTWLLDRSTQGASGSRTETLSLTPVRIGLTGVESLQTAPSIYTKKE